MALESKWADTSSDEGEPAIEFIQKKNNFKQRQNNNVNRSPKKYNDNKPNIVFNGGKLIVSDNCDDDNDNNSKYISKSRSRSPQKKKADNIKPNILFNEGKLIITGDDENNNSKHIQKAGSKSLQKRNTGNGKPNIVFNGGKLVTENDVKAIDSGKKNAKKADNKSKKNDKPISPASKLNLLKKKIEEQKSILKEHTHKKEQKQLLDAFLTGDDGFKWDNEEEEEKILESFTKSLKV